MNGGETWLGRAGTPLDSVGEFGLIARLEAVIELRTRHAGLSHESIAVGIGDDAASFRPTPGHEVLVTCDVQVAGRHFVPGWTTPRRLGARCATISTSDIGAMGGTPRAAVVSLGLEPGLAVEDVEGLYHGILDRLLGLNCLLIGGNVTSIPDGFFVDLTVLGEVERGRAVRRDTGLPGDIVWVTGTPGSAAAGLALLQAGGRQGFGTELDQLIGAYLDPRGRAEEGRRLGLSGCVSSMIDVSDGLLGDLLHLVEKREAGVVLKEEAIPIGPELEAAGRRRGRPPESFVLSASDDYELIFTTAPNHAEEAIRSIRAISDVPVWPIGEIVTGVAGQIAIEDRLGRRRPPPPGGWDHFRPAGGA